ncbi:hypothetical protein [Streptomyces sp. NBC_01264]|uniref:hypothetical protein n=1 Tax=Streptomyces sp. NBC_01264 TaxID=2903804 RepID=UPI00225385C3|nr:hypothetical protein [Streptomyces sp. NBC_01264]MCX4781520.1 hypothetical protein [Streptomyces sp. NBC_01264]
MENTAATITHQQYAYMYNWLAINPEISSALKADIAVLWCANGRSDFDIKLPTILTADQIALLKTLLDGDCLVSMENEQRHLALLSMIQQQIDSLAYGEQLQRVSNANSSTVSDEAISAMGKRLAENPKLRQAINKYADILSACSWESVLTAGIFEPDKLEALQTAVRTLWYAFAADKYVASLVIAAGYGHSGEKVDDSQTPPLPQADLLKMNVWLNQNRAIRDEIKENMTEIGEEDWDLYRRGHTAYLTQDSGSMLNGAVLRLWGGRNQDAFIPSLQYIISTFNDDELSEENRPTWFTPEHESTIEVLWPGGNPFHILAALVPRWATDNGEVCVARLDAKLKRRVAAMKPAGIKYPEVIDATISGVSTRHPVEEGTWKALIKDKRGEKAYVRGEKGSRPTKKSNWHRKAEWADSPELDDTQKSVVEAARMFASELARSAAVYLEQLANGLHEEMDPDVKTVHKLYTTLLNAKPTPESVSAAAKLYEELSVKLAKIPVKNWHKNHKRQGPDVTDSVRAFTVAGNSGIPVHVTSSFYDTDPQMQALDLLHESTHMYYSTTDEGGSGLSGIKTNAREGLGLERAYNIEWFARAIYRNEETLLGGATSDDEPPRKKDEEAKNDPIVPGEMNDDQNGQVEAAKKNAAGFAQNALTYFETAVSGGEEKLLVDWFGKSWREKSLGEIRVTLTGMTSVLGDIPVYRYGGGGDLKAKFTAWTDTGKAVYVTDTFFSDFSSDQQAFVILHESSHYVDGAILDYDLSRANGTSRPGARLIAHSDTGTAAKSAYNIQHFAESVNGQV